MPNIPETPFWETRSYAPDSFLAGMYPVAKDLEAVAGAAVKEYAPVMKNSDGKIVPIGSTNLTDLSGVYGIAVNAAENGKPVVVYRTGEFWGNRLALEDGVTLDAIRDALAALNIYLK